jgi:type II secretory pathway pseudopilin PulG
MILINKAGGEKHRPTPPRAEHAFSLVETVVAAMILGTATLSLFACFTSGFSIVQSSRENLRATQIMLQRVEAIRLFNWNQVLDTTNYLKPTFTEYYDPRGATNNTGGTLFQGFITSNIPTDLPVAYRTNMRTITVTLYWTNYMGNQTVVRTRQMQTRVARYGMENYIFGGGL